jgi:hypothetical protein
MPLAAIPPDTTDWHIRERGVRDGTSPTGTFEMSGSTGERTFRVMWEKRLSFATYMLGYGLPYTVGGVRKLSRLIPQALHPDTPDIRATRIVRVSGHQWTGTDPPRADGEPYVWTNGLVNVFTDAEIVVHYEHLPYAYLEDDAITTEMDRYVTRGDVRSSAEFLAYPGAGFKYARNPALADPADGADGTTIPGDQGVIVPQEEFVLTWERIPEELAEPGSDLHDTIHGTSVYDPLPYHGAINSIEFDGKPAGTVLLSGVRPIRHLSPLGSGFEYAMEYAFTYRPTGWNYRPYFQPAGAGTVVTWYFASKDGTHYAPGSVPDGKSYYHERDLNLLFSAGF